MSDTSARLSDSGKGTQSYLDMDWFRRESLSTLAGNRVTLTRQRGKHREKVTFHAPYAGPPPPRLPVGLGVPVRLWWMLKAPWTVRYPHQWFWDSCAHAIALSHLDPGLAKSEIRSLLSAQDETGFIPHMVWNPRRMHWADRIMTAFNPSRGKSPFLQPPMLAHTVDLICQRAKDPGFAGEVLEALERYYLYIERTRVRSNDGLPEIIISYESGKDRSREYDAVYGTPNTGAPLRGPMTRLMTRYHFMGWNLDRIFASNRFRVKDLLFDCVYAENLASLSRLFAQAKDPEKEMAFRRKAELTEGAILSKMYDPGSGLFFSLDARHDRDRLIEVSTISSLAPLILEGISKEQVERLVKDHLLSPGEFWTRYPLPVEPLSIPREKLKEHTIWRGSQTWVITNWFVVRGLRKQAARFPDLRREYTRIADEVTRRTCELVARAGFREYYDSETGEGGGAHDFGMATLVLDMIYNMENRPGGE